MNINIVQSPPPSSNASSSSSLSSPSLSRVSTTSSKSDLSILSNDRRLKRSTSLSGSSCREAYAQATILNDKQTSHEWPVTRNQAQNLTKKFDVQLKESVLKELGIQANKQTKNPWGNLSYSQLIEFAIESSPWKRLTLKEIYAWFTNYVPYFKDKVNYKSTMGWKNSIRHNLSLHKRFIRIDVIRCNKKRSMWTSLKYRPRKQKLHAKNKHKYREYSQINPYFNGLFDANSYAHSVPTQFLPFTQLAPCFNRITSVDSKCTCPSCIAFEAYCNLYATFLKTNGLVFQQQQQQLLTSQASMYQLLNQNNVITPTSSNIDEDNMEESHQNDHEGNHEESVSDESSTNASLLNKHLSFKRKLMDRYESEPSTALAFTKTKRKCVEIATSEESSNQKHSYLTELLQSDASSFKLLLKGKF